MTLNLLMALALLVGLTTSYCATSATALRATRTLLLTLGICAAFVLMRQQWLLGSMLLLWAVATGVLGVANVALAPPAPAEPPQRRRHEFVAAVLAVGGFTLLFRSLILALRQKTPVPATPAWEPWLALGVGIGALALVSWFSRRKYG